MYVYVAATLIALSVGFAGGWKVQGWRWDSAEKERVEQEAKDVRENRQLEREDNAIRDQAIADARLREQAARAAADGADAAAGRLRDDRADLQKRLSTAPVDACRRDAAALNDVLGACTAELGRMAREADGHASDSLMLQRAWPK